MTVDSKSKRKRSLKLGPNRHQIKKYFLLFFFHFNSCCSPEMCDPFGPRQHWHHFCLQYPGACHAKNFGRGRRRLFFLFHPVFSSPSCVLSRWLSYKFLFYYIVFIVIILHWTLFSSARGERNKVVLFNFWVFRFSYAFFFHTSRLPQNEVPGIYKVTEKKKYSTTKSLFFLLHTFYSSPSRSCPTPNHPTPLIKIDFACLFATSV